MAPASTGWLATLRLLGVSIGSGLLALSVPYLREQASGVDALASLSRQLPFLARSGVEEATATMPTMPDMTPAGRETTSGSADEYQCHPQPYSTSIVSLDPLVVYIHDFISPADKHALLSVGEPLFKPSHVTKHGRTGGTSDRTSWSAGLPRDDPSVQCVLARAQSFMGTMLAPGRDEMGPPQLVRYTAGQRFNLHHDWYPRFQPARDGRDAYWNRVASFFVFMEDDCTEGETYFPYIEAIEPQHGGAEKASQDDESTSEQGRGERDGGAEVPPRPRPLWRKHKDGGLAFRPVAGNALFWVNLHRNGTGDRRVMHAGLPVGEGLKTAMNIWPRQYVGPEAWDWPRESK